MGQYLSFQDFLGGLLIFLFSLKEASRMSCTNGACVRILHLVVFHYVFLLPFVVTS